MTPTFRYHPAVVAQAFATLGVMFPDRIVLGVGTGESLNEVPSTGVTWPDFKERFARLRQAVTLMRGCGCEGRSRGTSVQKVRPPGAVVLQVDPQPAAERAGLKPGDLVTELDGPPVRDAADLQLIGEVAEFAVSRPGGAVTVRAAMAEREPAARSK